MKQERLHQAMGKKTPVPRSGDLCLVLLLAGLLHEPGLSVGLSFPTCEMKGMTVSTS